MLKEKAVLHFSGGKDSTAMLYFVRDLLDRIDVMFCDTGKILPEIHDHIHSVCNRLKARLIIVHPPEDIDEYQERMGLPSDIIPIEYTAEARDLMHLPVKQPIQSYFTCCYNMIMKPLDDSSRSLGYNIILRGSKRADKRVGVEDGFIHDGVTYLSPLWDWTHEDVFRYLKEQGVGLPDHYKSFPDSLDCYDCTGHLLHYGADRIKYVREKHPERWPAFRDRLNKVRSVIMTEHVAVMKVMLGD